MWGRLVRGGTIFLAGVFIFLSLQPQKANAEELGPAVIENIKRTEFGLINYDQEADPYYGYIKGTIPVLISAPHGCKHYRTRESRWKEEDAYTSSLAIELGRLTGAHVLFLKNRAGEDPNNDIGTQYKKFLRKVVKKNGIRFVLDLHGAAADQPFKIDVGTMANVIEQSSCPTFRSIIEKNFSGFEEAIFNRRFAANGRGTVTCFARNTLRIEAAQIEINARYRIVESKTSGFKANSNDVLDLVKRLQGIVTEISQRIQSAGSGFPADNQTTTVAKES
jgi:hypothetical protein